MNYKKELEAILIVFEMAKSEKEDPTDWLVRALTAIIKEAEQQAFNKGWLEAQAMFRKPK